jgi:uroporphyrinogen-III decarboxylase
MNAREKFNAVMNFETDCQNMKTEYGYWAGALDKWAKDGLPKIGNLPENYLDGDLVRISLPLRPGSGFVDRSLISYFNLDPYPTKFPCDFSPMLEGKVIEDNDKHKIFVDEYGLTQKVLKKSASVPMIVKYVIKSAKDFNKYKDLYDKDYSKRLPKDWNNLVKELKDRNFAIRLGGYPFGFSGIARTLMGDVNYMLSLYDNPALLKDINEFYLNFVMNYWSEILNQIDMDWVMIWEDMAFRGGSFISKEAFREFLSPYYIRLVDFLKQYRIKNIIVDSDGLVEELIPLWLEAGVTGVFPLEAVNDLVKIRERHPKLQMLGGVDKKILMSGSGKDIDKELEQVSLLIKKGGYIPHIDHAIPMDAEWDKFKEYRVRLNDLIDGN